MRTYWKHPSYHPTGDLLYRDGYGDFQPTLCIAFKDALINIGGKARTGLWSALCSTAAKVRHCDFKERCVCATSVYRNYERGTMALISRLYSETLASIYNRSFVEMF